MEQSSVSLSQIALLSPPSSELGRKGGKRTASESMEGSGKWVAGESTKGGGKRISGARRKDSAIRTGGARRRKVDLKTKSLSGQRSTPLLPSELVSPLQPVKDPHVFQVHKMCELGT